MAGATGLVVVAGGLGVLVGGVLGSRVWNRANRERKGEPRIGRIGTALSRTEWSLDLRRNGQRSTP